MQSKIPIIEPIGEVINKEVHENRLEKKLPAASVVMQSKIPIIEPIEEVVNKEVQIALPQKQTNHESFVQAPRKKIKSFQLTKQIKAAKKIEMHLNKLILIYDCCQIVMKLHLFRKWKKATIINKVVRI